MRLILGTAQIQAILHQAISNKFDKHLFSTYSEFWNIAPVIIDSLAGYVVKSSVFPVGSILTYQLIQLNALSVTF